MTIMLMLAIFFLIIIVPIGIIAAIIVAIVKSEGQRNSGQPQPVQYVYQSGMQTPPKPKKKLSASAIMLLIGTAFIILSAITFVAANWVKMQPEGRVFAIAGASVLAFAISGVMKASAGLERTSAAFYVMGSLISVITIATAGYYEILGSWFSINGEGAYLLYAVMALIASAASFIGYPIYKSKALHYSGFSFISAAILFICIQLTENYEQFAAVIALAQLVITVFLHVIKPQKGTIVEKPATLIGDITAIIFELMALAYVLVTTFDATVYTFVVLAALLVQFFAYGTFKNQKWMLIFANVFSIYTALIAVIKAEDELGEAFVMLLFAFITMIIYLVNRFVPKNLEASRIVSMIGMGFGAFVALIADNEHLYGINLIVPAVFSMTVAGYGLHKSKEVQTVAGIIAPIMPFFMAVFLNGRLYDQLEETHSGEIKTIAFGGLALMYIALTAFFIYLPKLLTQYSQEHPQRSSVIIYSNMIAAAAVLMNISGYSQLFMVTAGLCVLHFILSHKMNYNITALGSVIGFVMLVNRVLQHYMKNDSEAEMYVMFGVFILMMIVSRLIFSESFVVKKQGMVTVDVLLLGAWTSVLPFPSFNRVSLFLRIIAIAVFLAGFIKKKTSKNSAAILLSFSAFLTAVAFITRPFLNPESSMVSSKITLGIMLLLGIAYKYIWKNNKSASKTLSTLIFVLTFTGLIVDGLIYSSVLNKIFVLVVTAAVLLLSFFVKSKTWFVSSSLALVIMTVFSTRKYFDTAGWWIYLLVVGIVFVVIAAVNEACKKKGETLKSSAAKKFSDWTW